MKTAKEACEQIKLNNAQKIQDEIYGVISECIKYRGNNRLLYDHFYDSRIYIPNLLKHRTHFESLGYKISEITEPTWFGFGKPRVIGYLMTACCGEEK